MRREERQGTNTQKDTRGSFKKAAYCAEWSYKAFKKGTRRPCIEPGKQTLNSLPPAVHNSARGTKKTSRTLQGGTGIKIPNNQIQVGKSLNV